MKPIFTFLSMMMALIATPARAGSCIKVGEVCMEPTQTRIIDGERVTRDCWRYQNTFQCLGAETTNNCTELRDAGCSQIGSTCLSTDDTGACVSYEQTYRCETAPWGTTQVTTCGNTLTCIDGKCFDTAVPPNTDFVLAATHLNVMQEAGQDFNADDFQIFKGRRLGCSKTFLSFSDCCGDKGWGLDLNLAICNEEEKRLIEAARGERCHVVGSFCADKTLFGICRQTQLNWCCFNSKLARLVNEQGRPQISKSWGSVENPDCSGFTPEQLQSLDFAAMDLSEFYGDVMRQAKGMDFNQVQQNVTDRLTNYYNTGRHSIPAGQAAPYDSSLAPPAGTRTGP